ncbi:MAG: SDR family NAD(P)-dependent oxidoreductase, partial [Opitutaceae bacterium]|nr:SDR family NAD(P)-dependent oxidoreductase [Opitutaceae bacterium]
MPSPFDISGRVVAVTGATGVLAGSLARHLAAQGALVALLGRDPAKLDAALAAFPPGQAAAFACDVLDRPSLERARDTLAARFGRLDALVNGAGGNLPGAIVPPDGSFFDLDPAQWQSVLNLNLGGTLLPTLVLGALFEKPRRGSILNFSSMAAGPAITRVLGYSNAKAGVDNLTRWLAVEFARKIGPDVRVNALAPGFFISAQ